MCVCLCSCVFMRCSGNYGGALKCSSESTLDLLDSTFSDNEATFAGGAISVESSLHVQLTSVIFLRNRSQRGGAVVLGNAMLTMSSCHCTHSLSLYGGCIYAEDFSLLTANDCSFTDSTSLLGGVMYLVMGEANFTECLFARNSGLDSQSELTDLDPVYSGFTGEASTGGAFTSTLAKLRIDRCSARDNSAQQGE
jgi:predicted outer membrane repeat protein